MKKMVSVREFKEYCDRHASNVILFCSENQNCFTGCHSCFLSLCFAEIFVHENPNLIWLKSVSNDGVNQMRIDNVKCIEIDTDYIKSGDIFTVFSEIPGVEESKVAFRFNWTN